MRAVATLLLLGAVATAQAEEVNPPHPKAAKLLARKEACLRFARDFGEHLLRHTRPTERGLTATSRRDVYRGDAGVALFLFDLHAATGEKRWSEAGGKLLANALALDRAQAPDPGLYTGTAGVGQVCVDAWHATRDKRLLKEARECAARLRQVEGYTVTDIISGAAGTGIFYLNLHAATKDEQHLRQARAVGDYLVRTAVRKEGTASWPVRPGHRSATYLGLSHGAAGIGYYLLHLHRVTQDEAYRGLAEEAARFVLAHAVADGADGYKWTKIQPPRKDAYPVQWCHGSPGMGLFFCELERHLGADAWAEPLDRCLASTLREGRTSRVGGCQCHGVSGNAELFVEAYRLRRDPKLLDAARLFGSALLEPRGKGFQVQVALKNYRYPPGYMLGVAGIGRYFLRLAAPDKTPLPLWIR
jgi:lantibiotic modifying enzyme